jgi:S1-C subfamily serine protease
MAPRVSESCCLTDAGPTLCSWVKILSLIIAFKEQPVTGVDELLRKLVAAEIGLASVLTVLRQTEKLEIRITPQELLRNES